MGESVKGCPAACCYCFAVALTFTWSGAQAQSQSWSRDPLVMERMTAPAPEKSWEPDKRLPLIPVPEFSGALGSGQPLTLPELTEYALRSNPRTRQSWFAARAAAANIGVTRGDDLPEITGSYSGNRSHPVSGTTGSAAPWLTRYGPAISFNYVLFDFGA